MTLCIFDFKTKTLIADRMASVGTKGTAAKYDGYRVDVDKIMVFDAPFPGDPELGNVLAVAGCGDAQLIMYLIDLATIHYAKTTALIEEMNNQQKDSGRISRVTFNVPDGSTGPDTAEVLVISELGVGKWKLKLNDAGAFDGLRYTPYCYSDVRRGGLAVGSGADDVQTYMGVLGTRGIATFQFVGGMFSSVGDEYDTLTLVENPKKPDHLMLGDHSRKNPRSIGDGEEALSKFLSSASFENSRHSSNAKNLVVNHKTALSANAIEVLVASRERVKEEAKVQAEQATSVPKKIALNNKRKPPGRVSVKKTTAAKSR